MSTFFQVTLGGASIGTVYGLVAVGLVMVYRATGIINFAQGETYMLGAVVSLVLLNAGIPMAISAALAVFIVCLVFGLIDVMIYRPLSSGPPINVLVATLAVAIGIRNLAELGFGVQPRPYPRLVQLGVLSFLGMRLDGQLIIAAVVDIFFLVLLVWFFKASRFGLAMRAVASDVKVSALMGIEPRRSITAAVAVGAGLGAVAGIVVAPTLFVSAGMGSEMTIHALAAAVVGGLTSVRGSLAGGVLLGAFEALVGYYISSSWKSGVAFALIIVVLLVRPSGLFGQRVVVRA